MTSHDQIFEWLEAYALDTLDEPEVEQVRAHLAECAACRAEVARLTEATSYLARLSPLRSPAPDLRGRVVAAVEREARSPERTARPPQPQPALRGSRPIVFSRRPSLARAAQFSLLFVSQVVLLLSVLILQAQNEQQAQIQAILLSDDEPPTQLVSPDATSLAHGTYRAEFDLRRGLINYYQLPQPGSGQSYQCWLEFDTHPAAPCGRLPVEANGHGLLLFTLPEPLPNRLRVTLETGRASTPTGPTLLVAEIVTASP